VAGSKEEARVSGEKEAQQESSLIAVARDSKPSVFVAVGVERLAFPSLRLRNPAIVNGVLDL